MTTGEQSREIDQVDPLLANAIGILANTGPGTNTVIAQLMREHPDTMPTEEDN